MAVSSQRGRTWGNNSFAELPLQHTEFYSAGGQVIKRGVVLRHYDDPSKDVIASQMARASAG